jgi:hypothetical protein
MSIELFSDSLDEELNSFPNETSFDIQASNVQPLNPNEPIFDIKPLKNPKFQYIFTEKEQHIQRLEKKLEKVKEKPKKYPENQENQNIEQDFFQEEDPENESFIQKGNKKQGMIQREYSIESSDDVVIFEKSTSGLYDNDDEFKSKKKKGFFAMLCSCCFKNPEDDLYLDFDDYDKVEDEI